MDDTYGSEGWNSNATMQYMTYDVPDKDTVTFVLPENYEVNKDNWKVWILAAQENGETKSDYASAPVEITIPDLDEAEDHPQVGRTKAPNSLKIKVNAAGNKNYKAVTKAVTVTVRVR